jgi:hypothetical protein
VNEASVTVKWRNFLKNHPPGSTETYELKFVDISKVKLLALIR